MGVVNKEVVETSQWMSICDVRKKYGMLIDIMVILFLFALWSNCMTLAAGTEDIIEEHVIPVTVSRDLNLGCPHASAARDGSHFLTQCSKQSPPPTSSGQIMTSPVVENTATTQHLELNSNEHTDANVNLIATPSPPVKVHSGCSLKVSHHNASVAVRCACKRYIPGAHGIFINFRADYEAALQFRPCLASCVSTQFSLHQRCSRGETLVAATTEAFKACCLHACYGSWDATLEKCNARHS